VRARVRARSARVAWLLALAGCVAAPRAPEVQDGSPPPPAPNEPSPAPPPITGQLLSRYRARFTNDESDHDLYETLDVAIADPGKRWTASVLARAVLDLDGIDDGPSSDFYSLLDTYDHQLAGQLFHAYLDVATEDFSMLRIGRQTLYETPLTVVFDGLRAELAPRGEQRYGFGAFTGVGEHMYESSSEGDFVLGGYGSMKPWTGGELRADWMHLEDERLGNANENDLLGLFLGQDFVNDAGDERTRLETRFTSLEGDGRDLRVSGSHLDAVHGFSLQASAYRLLQTQEVLAAPLDPFSDTLFELFPYTQLQLSGKKDWKHLELLLGSDVRRVDDADDEGDFNRDFERYFVTGSLAEELPVDVSLTGEVWRATGTDYSTWGASLGRRLDGGWDLSLGSYFALYEYDLTSAEERERVRTTYLDVRWKTGPARHWGLRYEYEHNDIDDYQEVRLDYAWGF
jgi:hypothetical protein